MDTADSRGCFNNFYNSKNSNNSDNAHNAYNDSWVERGIYLDDEKGRNTKICGHLRQDDRSRGRDGDRSRLVIIEKSVSGHRYKGEGHQKGNVPARNNGEEKNREKDISNGVSASEGLAKQRSFPQLVDNPVENDTVVTPPL